MVATRVEFENEVYAGETLTDAEKALLLHQVYGVLASPATSVFGQILKDNEPAIIGACEVAKAQMNTPFKGVSAGDSELGMQLIRPGHVLRSTSGTETPANDWTITVASGNSSWIGYNTSNATAINIDKRAVILALAVAWTQGPQPQLEEVEFTVGGTIYPVVVIRHGWLSDNTNLVRMARLRPNLWRGKQTVLGNVNCKSAGQQEAVLLGITFATGDFLRLRSYTTVQT